MEVIPPNGVIVRLVDENGGGGGGGELYKFSNRK